VGAGIGWALLGPLGALVGGLIGNFIDKEGIPRAESAGWGGNFFTKKSTPFFGNQSFRRTQPGDFLVSVVVLCAEITRADEKIKSAEIEAAKKYFLNTFGAEKTRDLMHLLKGVLQQPSHLPEVCRQIAESMEYEIRLNLLETLFTIAQSDQEILASETRLIENIAHQIGINPNDYRTVAALFIRDPEHDCKILGVSPQASSEEIKKNYRELVKKFHPDKVAHLGDEFKELAEKKFKEIQEAYERVLQTKS